MNYSDLTSNEYLKSTYRQPQFVLNIYLDAAKGLNPCYYGRDEEDYKRARSSVEAAARLVATAEELLGRPWWPLQTVTELSTLRDRAFTDESQAFIRDIFAAYPNTEWYRKQIVVPNRNSESATPKQIAYLARLGSPGFTGSKGEASLLIDKLKNGS